MLRRAIAYARRPDIRRDMPRCCCAARGTASRSSCPATVSRSAGSCASTAICGCASTPRRDRPRDLQVRRLRALQRGALRTLLARGSVVVDAGANIGQYTLLAAKATAPRGRVLAFEPEPDTFGELRHNVLANRLTNVDVFQ